MTNPATEMYLDPWAAPLLEGGPVDNRRTLGLPAPHAENVARAAAALANTRGGDLLLGVALGADACLSAPAGLSAETAETALIDGLSLVDPPITHLVKTRLVEQAAGAVLVARVRMSPSTPHLVTDGGGIPRLGDDGIRPVASRRELDDLYARGRGERERADRLIDAMIEKLTLAHYAFYSVAIIACTHEPSAEPFSAAAAGLLAPPDDPFVRAFGLAAYEPRSGPAELELRGPEETGAYLRVTRSGCVAAGEVQRRPYHEELDQAARFRDRLESLAASACRLLGHAADPVMVPHLFVEGVRGLRLVLNAERRITTGSAPQDTARYALPLGDARDPEYPARLALEAFARLESLFRPPEA